jgi:hypothetical protein
MRWVEQQTGKAIRVQLMAGGPAHADLVYEKMFAYYLCGYADTLEEKSQTGG